jgi:hypothetical protein
MKHKKTADRYFQVNGEGNTYKAIDAGNYEDFKNITHTGITGTLDRYDCNDPLWVEVIKCNGKSYVNSRFNIMFELQDFTN